MSEELHAFLQWLPFGFAVGIVIGQLLAAYVNKRELHAARMRMQEAIDRMAAESRIREEELRRLYREATGQEMPRRSN